MVCLDDSYISYLGVDKRTLQRLIWGGVAVGCVTCKAKRLKCDETKPECQQCHKRNVPCGGYKKDFKWRPFEETTFANKVVLPKTKTGKHQILECCGC